MISVPSLAFSRRKDTSDEAWDMVALARFESAHGFLAIPAGEIRVVDLAWRER